MGANAQTSVPAFVTGQVLTAQQQTEINTGIPVFADSTARDAAFGGTGEKVLAEGQYAFLESTNQTLVYDGASWIAVGASGLALVKSQVIGTTVGSVTVTDAFSATYDNYLITVNGGVASTDNILNFTLGGTTSGYRYNQVFMAFTSTTVNGGQSNSHSSWTAVVEGSANNLSGRIELQNPFLTKNTVAYFTSCRSASGGEQILGWGALDNTTSYTAFTLTANAGTITGGTIRVYGYANS